MGQAFAKLWATIEPTFLQPMSRPSSPTCHRHRERKRGASDAFTNQSLRLHNPYLAEPSTTPIFGQ